MTRTLLRPAAAAAGLLSIALLLAGCGGEEPPAGAPSASQAATATTTAPEPAAGGTTETTGAAAGGTAAGVSACAPGDVSAELTLQPGSPRALLAVTNASKAACSVSGSPDILLLDPTGAATKPAVRKVDQPGPAEEVVLEPGRTAFGGIKWVPCDKASTSCPVGNAIQVGLPGGTVDATLREFPAPEKVAITMRSLQVGTLQPSNQGVVAW